MNEKEARENVKEQLEGIKKANECGLATKGEFNRDIEAIETILNLLEKKDKESHFIQSELDIANAKIIKLNNIVDEIQKEVRDHIGFENRLKRDNIDPDLFNQGRFYVANNINNILKGK